jgi:hypothetical protein
MTPTALASVWPPNHLVASRAGHMAISPVEAIRQKCLDCSGQPTAEVKVCETVTCALWPFRAGRHPYTKKSLQQADSEHCASVGIPMPLACPSSRNSIQEADFGESGHSKSHASAVGSADEEA